MKILITVILAGILVVVLVSLTIRESGIAEGKALYNKQCAACHGEQGTGQGSVGTSLNNPQFLNSLTNQDIINITKFGRQGTSMQAYQNVLPDEQIEKIASYIRTWQQGKVKYPVPATIAGDKNQGAELYKVFCASCHGADGKGKATGTALNNPQYLKYTTDQQIWIATAYGRDGTTMGPSLQGLNGVKQLTEEEISHIVSFIRSFQQ